MIGRVKDLIILVRHLRQGVPFYRLDKILPFIFRFLFYGNVKGVLYSDVHSEGFYKVKTPRSEMVLDLTHYAQLRLEENNYWKRFYCPIDLTGLKVLDAGAGNGETVDFYLRKGASFVRAIECDYSSFFLLQSNTDLNSWPAELRLKKFSIEDLEGMDFAKIDIEEGELELLKLDSLPCSMVVEAHTPEIKEILIKKFPFTVVYNTFHFSFLQFLCPINQSTSPRSQPLET